MRLGRNMKHALDFIRRVQGWHGFDRRCQATRRAIARLAAHGLVQVNEFSQFRQTSGR
jgi:hypothetical protein